jgi:hypothetical protein
VLLFISLSCSSISVSVDYDRTTDFSQLKNYKWIKQKDKNNETSILLNDINKKRFASAIQNELSEKGFKKSDDEKSDFSVVYHVRLDKKLDISAYNYNYGPYYEPNIQTRIYQRGTIIIDIIHTEGNLLVWRGVAEGVLSEKEEDWSKMTDMDSFIIKVVHEILKNFPPF